MARLAACYAILNILLCMLLLRTSIAFMSEVIAIHTEDSVFIDCRLWFLCRLLRLRSLRLFLLGLGLGLGLGLLFLLRLLLLSIPPSTNWNEFLFLSAHS